MRKLPESEQVPYLQDYLLRVVRGIVEHEDIVYIECKEAPLRAVFTVFVHYSDMGLVLGDKGATANSIRRIVWTACKKTNLKADIDFLTASTRS